MNAEALYEIFKATLPQKEQQRFMRLLNSEPIEIHTTPQPISLRARLLARTKLDVTTTRKIPNTA